MHDSKGMQVEAQSRTNSGPDSEESAGPAIPSVLPRAQIASRKQLPRTRLGGGQGILDVEAPPDADRTRTSLATRRHAWLRRRRRKRILTAIAIIFGLFPPMWAVYLIAWLIWRSRPEQQSMRLVRRAVRALERNQTGVALKQLQDAHYLDPSNNDALYWLGLLLSRQNRHEEAAEALSLVAERVPGLPEVESALAGAYVAIQEPEGAIYHAQRLFDVAPYAPDTLLKLADAFDAAGRLDLAVQALEQAPLHKPRLTEGLLQIHYRLGMIHERQGDRQRALNHFKRVYAQDITFRDIQARLNALESKPDPDPLQTK